MDRRDEKTEGKEAQSVKLSKLAMLLARCGGECKDRRRAEISCAEARRLAHVMLEVSRLGGSGRERWVEERHELAEREEVKLDAERSRRKST